MNEQGARHAIKVLIDDNAESIMEGIMMQGSQRSIAHVAISEAALPSGTGSLNYPFFRVICTRAYERKIVSAAALLTKARYEVQILASDESAIQLGDTTPSEQMDSNFRTICDRIVNLVLTTSKFTYGTSSYVLITEDETPVMKENNDGWSGDTVFFGAIITFTIEEC